MNAKNTSQTVLTSNVHKAIGGKVFHNSMLDVFGTLVYNLNLHDEKPKRPLFSKSHYPFSFEVGEAISTMAALKLNIEWKTATTTISYSISPELAFALIRRCFEGKLLHCPGSRTESKLTRDVVLQVTPKGTALVYAFCKTIGMPREIMPPIVKSAFNSMSLFSFDRSLMTDRILYSEFLLHILFIRLMGPAPNVWSAQRKADPIPSLFDNFLMDPSFGYAASEPKPTTEIIEPITPKLSPFHHRYFTNPESNAHVQYYVSDTGVRVFCNKVLGEEPETVVDIIVSGKAIVQWLCDCTNILSVSEAVQIGGLLVGAKLLEPIGTPGFSNQRDAFYSLTPLGREICSWELGSKRSSCLTVVSISESSEAATMETKSESCKLSLKEIIDDPGTRFLFKMHLLKERCFENIDAYVLLVEFAKLRDQLVRLLHHYERITDEKRRKAVADIIETKANTCYSTAFHLYSTYISPESQYDLNIDFGLRQEVYEVMANVARPRKDFTKTPVDGHFFEEEQLPAGPGQVADTMVALNRIHVLFGRVATSIYRLMEVDSYPRFIASDDYLSAMVPYRK